MFLKSLTLKGFKSFADPTAIEFQPGVTVVVGPNGSGKSNVVDAVAWVLGAQGPRVVRSARMDDVIFAGTAKRPPLGRAEVALTIDNSSGRLRIDLGEITVSRTLFRTGDSEYAINGVSCRLLDVQELFSDTGVGRQQHVIIGQGQLDSVLGARPEERRMVVEEAAGVLKFRRRKERAERRLEASEASLARLQDLQRELRRQLRPLERQAASAVRHEELSSELRALRLHLAGQELRALVERLAAADAESAALQATEQRLGSQLAGLDLRLHAAEAELTGELAEELEPLVTLGAQLRERSDGLLARCRERRRSQAELAGMLADGEEVAALEEERHRAGIHLEACDAEAARLLPEWEALGEAERELAEREAADLERYGAESRDVGASPSAGLRAQRSAASESVARDREEEVRSGERLAALAGRRRAAEERLARARAALGELAPLLQGAERDQAGLAEALRLTEVAAAATAEGRRRAEEEHQAARARVGALALALDEARARAGLERLADLPGVLGTLLDVVEVEEGAGPAFEAAVAGVLDAVLVAGGRGPVQAALERLRSGGGGALLPLLDPAPPPAPAGPPPLGTVPLVTRVRAVETAARPLVEWLLAGVFVADGPLEAAVELALGAPQATIVTTGGDRLAPSGWRLGSGGAGVTRAALEAAAADERATRSAAAAAAAADQAAASELEGLRRSAGEGLRRLDRLAADAERGERDAVEAAAEVVATRADEARLAAEAAAATSAASSSAAALAALDGRLAAAEREEQAAASRAGEAAAARRQRDERARALAALRRDLEVRAAALEERRSMLAARQAELAERVAARAGERERAAERRLAHQRDGAVLARLEAVIDEVRSSVAAAASRAEAELRRRAEQAERRRRALAAARAEREERQRTLEAARQRAQRVEVERTEARVRHETAVGALERELGATAEEALAAPRPGCPDGEDLHGRLRQLEGELAMLGPVNPLARQELAALSERSAFVDAQLEDIRAARRELGQVIRAVDDEIVEVFAAAFADVERHFERLVATLFPGGSGRLVLTTPDDMLTTGIEVEARPAGRNLRRLSLLSGGERSMVALAFLFAVFRSRPSPFYLLDEVEAALDEVNLRRFLGLLDEFRDEAQLIVVSHQKRTMEVADALYGVSMQPGGGSKVVSEQLQRAAAMP